MASWCPLEAVYGIISSIGLAAALWLLYDAILTLGAIQKQGATGYVKLLGQQHLYSSTVMAMLHLGMVASSIAALFADSPGTVDTIVQSNTALMIVMAWRGGARLILTLYALMRVAHRLEARLSYFRELPHGHSRRT